MKVLISYSENSNDIINYQELSELKNATDSQPDILNKQVYLDIENSTQLNPYITVSMTDALTTNSFHNIKSKNTITIYDDISKFYYIGSIIKAIYVNNLTCRIEFQILPIQTNILNGIDRFYDCCFIKTPNVPTYSNNISQSIVGETVTSVNYNSAISGALSTFQSTPVIMVVINKDLTPLGLVNGGRSGKIPAGEIILKNPLPPCSSQVGGATLPGFTQFFTDVNDLQSFLQSCYEADIKIENPIFANDGETYQTAKVAARAASSANGIFPLISLFSDLEPTMASRGFAILDASKVNKYYIPEPLSPADIIMCKEIPIALSSFTQPVSVAANLPIVINNEPYFNISSLLQVKIITSMGQTLTLDGNNILFNDGNPATGFSCNLVASLSGIDLIVGESSYSLNICKFPDISYSGNSFENPTTTNIRTGIVTKATTFLTNISKNVVDLAIDFIGDGKFGNSPSSKSYEQIPLDKTSVVGTIQSTAWTQARVHIETTYLPSGVKNRLNSVYNRFGFDDYIFNQINLNSIPKGYWQASQVQEVNPNNNIDVSFINSNISDGVKQQLSGGVYVK